ncbi:MAG: protease HtpX [Pseudomonadota bacterium]|nr:protease HtpX [Pseudomonadota bacterium]
MFNLAKRVFLMLLLNILVLVTISIILSVTGLGSYFFKNEGDYLAMYLFCFVWGTVGAFISLLLSKFFAKMMMGVQIVDPNSRDANSRELVVLVHGLARRAGLIKMPEVGIYESPEINAFATGPSKNNSLVAVSTGLLNRMDRDQLEGVLGHELAHVANGDMVTMTIVQGIVNSFVMFFARIIASILAPKDSEGRSNFFGYYMTYHLVEIALMFLTIPIVAGVSRWREYRADLGGAKIAGKEKMIGALKALSGTEKSVDNKEAAFASLKISGKRSGGLALFFMTHPPLEDRIRRLEQARV